MIFEKPYSYVYKRMLNETSPTLHNLEIFNINRLDIPFSKSWKRIAVSLSGGADSALLTFLLCKIIKDNNIDCKIDAISFIRMWDTRPWQGDISSDVFNKLKSMFPEIICDRHTSFVSPLIEKPKIKDGSRERLVAAIQSESFYNYLIYKNGYDVIFNATTHNPHGVTNIKDIPVERNRDLNQPTVSDVFAKKVFQPFIFVDKSWIIAQYHLFDILDLFNTTRSCEGSIGHKSLVPVVPDLNSYKKLSASDIPECGQCYWCQERDWAKSKLEETLDEIKNV